MAELPIVDPPSAPVGTGASAAVPLTYAPALRRRRVRRYFRPGTPLFFLIVLALVAGAIWGGWKWRLREDRKAFEACTTELRIARGFAFIHPPTRGALRHLARLPGRWTIALGWPATEGRDAVTVVHAVKLGNVSQVWIGQGVDADAMVKELTRPDCSLKNVTALDLVGAQVTDASLRELARPDSGLKALDMLIFENTQATDAGVKELTRPDSGVKAVRILDLEGMQVTDVGAQELARPDCGLKALTTLELDGTRITDAGLKQLAGPDCALKRLVTLTLERTRVTDAGLKELARPDCSLKGLGTLYVRYTRVTDVGVVALKKAKPGLRIVH